jgi:hypothetical protein
MKTLHSKSLVIALIMGLFAHPSTMEAFLSPKQKYKMRMEKKTRQEDPANEYIYYNKVKNAFYGGLCLPLGFIMTIGGFLDPQLSALETCLFSVAGPLLTIGSIKLLNNALHAGPAVIITESGICTNDNGLTLWEEIKKGIVSYATPYGIMLECIDGSTVFINCDGLNTSIEKLLMKVNRFKKFNLSGNILTIIHEEI